MQLVKLWKERRKGWQGLPRIPTNRWTTKHRQKKNIKKKRWKSQMKEIKLDRKCMSSVAWGRKFAHPMLYGIR